MDPSPRKPPPLPNDSPPTQDLIAVPRQSPNHPIVLYDVQLSPNDARDWSKRDAFRHFYVNWREGMREVSKLPTKPAVEYTETNAFTTIRALRPDYPFKDPRPCGFIQFNQEKGTLVLNITDGLMLRGYLNHQVHGYSSQSQSQSQGQGQDQGQDTPSQGSEKRPSTPSNKLLKAAMVMMLSGYQVRFESSKDRWDFFFVGETFSFSRTPATEDAFLDSLNQDSFSSSPVDKVSVNDLAIVIGPGPGPGPGLDDDKSRSRKVDRAKLFRWLGVTLDITNFGQPSSVIAIEFGDLILDPQFANSVYANGILLSTSHLGVFAYGYHFHTEEIVADGLVLAVSEKEAQLRCRIWEAAVEKDRAVLGLLVGLLRGSPRVCDVRGMEVYLQPVTVVKIWEFLVLDGGHGKIYCQETDDLDKVRQHTARQIVVISPLLWSILRHPSLIRTWEEELLFTAAPAMPPQDLFSAIINRAFKALLKLDAYTANAAVIFVEHPLGTASIHCDVRVRVFAVSKYWLDFDVVHAIHSCRRSAAPKKIITNFPCDHVIISMYEHAIEVASRTISGTPEMRAAWRLSKQQIAIQSIEEMPRLVSIRQSVNPGELCVLWQHGVPPQVSEMVNHGYHVVLHQETCITEHAAQFLHNQVYQSQESDKAPCGCWQKVIPQGQLIATFSNLDSSRKYMPMVALNTTSSIYGVPPTPIQPRATVQAQPQAQTQAQAQTQNPEVPCTALTNPSPEGFRSNQPTPDFWETWQKTNYPVIFALFAPRYGSPFAQNNPTRRPVASYQNDRLRYRFERHQHVVATIRGAVPPGPVETRHFLLYVHGVYPPETPDEGEGHVLVTMFSFLRTTSFCLFQVGLANDARVGLRELLLHFRDFDAMGSRQDAIVVPVREFVSVEGVSPFCLGQFESVVYTVDPPPDQSRTGYFCRFAIQGGAPADSACVMPVASHLLPHSQRWSEPRYYINPKPSVIDFSSGCLGLAEGFAQAGCSIDAAFAYDPARDHTWKARHPSAKLYDGTLPQILTDLSTKTLNRPPSGPKGTPRIILLSIPDTVNSTKPWEQTITEFKIAHLIPRVLAAFPQKPDFWVFTMPPWMFLERAFNEFFRTLWALLGNRYAVHLRTVCLRRFGIPLDGHVLVMVASCVPSPIPWGDIFNPNPNLNPSYPSITTTMTGTNGTVTIASRISDLNFFNPRPSPPPNMNTIGKTLVCKHPVTNADVYNHETGWMVLTNCGPPASLNLNSVVALGRLKRGVKHFQRGDILTVRELARIQGFPDNFIFLGSYAQQYADVLHAFPPPIARLVAGCLLLAAMEYATFGERDGDGDGFSGGGDVVVQRGRKRLREG